ncbi:hypothetical protein PAL_GLEAN10012869 [Pteropus alecto]|uniref:Uncharacterized protein n=1 Tax=Pteropus alecto TaxID=9402 RepID=L5KQT2_PTEAL|nr:hypothetical protein PAL_GLEAN10012869 [Pteropus alecto]
MKLGEKRIRNEEQETGPAARALRPGGGGSLRREAPELNSASPHPCPGEYRRRVPGGGAARSPLTPFLLPSSRAPAVPAAPEPGESAASAQVPAAALALEVGAAPRPGRGGLPRDLVPAALALCPSSFQPRAAGRSPPNLDRTSAASRDQPPWRPSGASPARLPVQLLQSGR